MKTPEYTEGPNALENLKYQFEDLRVEIVPASGDMPRISMFKISA
jgi:hypothetical protein